MTRKRITASRAASSRVADDFKLINGIGTAYEKSLHNAGVHTFAQLAKKSPEEVATFISYLSASQVRKQGWIPQARKLSRKTGSNSRRKEAAGLPSSQHYENFTLEFLLTEANKIRRIRIVHVQSGEGDSWTNWNIDELSNFLARHTQASFPKRKNHKHKTAIGKPGTMVENPASAEPLREEPQKSKYLAPITFFPAVKTPPKTKLQESKTRPGLKGQKVQPEKVRVLKWIIYPAGSNQPAHTLSHGQTFDVLLTLDISNLSISGISKLEVIGRLFAKKLGSEIRHAIGETQTIVPYSPVIDLSVGKAVLEQGLYRMEAQIKLGNSEAASLQGGLFQVY